MMRKTKKIKKEESEFIIFLVLAIIVILIAVFADRIVPMDPYKTELKNALQPPGKGHLFGTDTLGRDLFSRVIMGSRTSLSAAMTLVLIIMVFGTTLGIFAGYFGGIINTVIMRFSDMMISFPSMILAVAVAGLLGASVRNAVIAIALTSWPKYARLSRSMVLRIRNRDYVKAAKINGSSHLHRILAYMLPNTIPTMIITAATDIGSMMLGLAGLSFLGFGAQSPTAEWGLMMNEGREFFATSPWLVFVPGAAIFITVTIFNLLGDSLRDVMDSGI